MMQVPKDLALTHQVMFNYVRNHLKVLLNKNFNGLVIVVLYLLKLLGVKEVLTLIFLYSEQIVKQIILTETLEF